MSTQPKFSNTDTGDKPADPYKQANTDTEATVEQKIEALNKFMTSSKYGMMTTRDSQTGQLVSRAMALTAQESGGVDLIFHTNTESHKTDELHSDPHVNISFLNSSGEWASISGVTEIITERSVVKKYYKPTLKAWVGDLGDGVHDGSENDPRIGIIRVKMVSATYSIATKGTIGQVLDVAQGTVTGKTAHVNKLRELSEADVKSWRSTH